MYDLDALVLLWSECVRRLYSQDKRVLKLDHLRKTPLLQASYTIANKALWHNIFASKERKCRLVAAFCPDTYNTSCRCSSGDVTVTKITQR